MAECEHKRGVTLVEILVVVGVIATLASMVIVATRRLDTQSKENTLANTFAVLESALGQFHEYEYTYSFPTGSVYAGLDLHFPLDCTDFSVLDLRAVLQQALGAQSVAIVNHADAKGREYVEYSGCEVLYFFLSQVPESAGALKGIGPALVTNTNGEGKPVQIVIDARPAAPFSRIVDPWGTTLRYRYYDVQPPPAGLSPIPATQKSFPILLSAGPDKKFGTADDISSRGK
jgi:prepilin-type N-terminal cleavage/methylation domain-containing protein